MLHHVSLLYDLASIEILFAILPYLTSISPAATMHMVDRGSPFFNVFSKEWPPDFAGSRKPIDDRPVLDGLIETVRSSGNEPEGDDHQLFMDPYDDDMTSLDVRKALDYLQAHKCTGLHDLSQAERKGTAWLDDRTFDRPVPQELPVSGLTMAVETEFLGAHQTPHICIDSGAADTHPPWTDPPEASSTLRDITNTAADNLQDSPHAGYNMMSSCPVRPEVRSSRRYPAPLTADDLHTYLRERQFDHAIYLDADRRLIYIADPDADYMSSLIKTARAHQHRSLQNTLCKYIAQDTSIKVSISEGHMDYQLEFHMPYFAMRHRSSQGSTERKKRTHRGWMNIDFLDTKGTNAGLNTTCGVHQGQISVAICGTDNSRWTAFCLEDRHFDEDGEMGEDEHTDVHQSDQIARGAFGAENTIWDPREYFIRVFLVRMRQVHKEWIDLVRLIESGIKEHSWGRFFFSHTRDGIPSAVPDTAASNWIEPTVELLGKLLEEIANINDAWARFTSATGDVAYFFDIRSNPHVVATFNELNDVFSHMGDIEKKLGRIAEQCEQRARTVSLRLASDSKRSAELTIYFISPFAIVSTFFAIPAPIIGFDRNILSFSIAILLYIVILQALLFFWGGRISQQTWWNKISRRAKAVWDGDPGCTTKNEAGKTVLQRRSTYGYSV